MRDLLEAYWEPIARHRRWYGSFYKLDHLRRWEQLLRRQPEAAICEALVREELERYVDVVYPNENLATGGPDFKCYRMTRAGQQHFYVESTCLTIDAVTKETGLEHPLQKGAFHYRPLTDRFKEECRSKSGQLSNLDAPGILAISTLHTAASGLCFLPQKAKFILTSETLITQKIDTQTGDPVGEMYLSTDLRKSAFQRPKKGMPWIVEEASRSVSGIILCPFGHGGPYDLHGVLHPNAVRPFDVELMPGVFFSYLHGDATSGLQVRYIWHERA